MGPRGMPVPPIYIYISFLLIKQFSFTGISSFAHLKPVKCLVEPDERYDIAVVGAPFDTAVSYRPGNPPPRPPSI